MSEGSGMSFIGLSDVSRTMQKSKTYGKLATALMKSFHKDNQKRKQDPFTPASRSKGEKARNRRMKHKRSTM